MTANSSLIDYKEKIKRALEKKTIRKTVFFFIYALILFLEALEEKGHTLEEYRSCELLNSLYQLQKLSVKKRRLLLPFFEMSSTISYWLNSGQEDVGYIKDSTEKLESKLNSPLTNTQWEQFYSIFRDMMKHSNIEENIYNHTQEPITVKKVVHASNTNLPKPWSSDTESFQQEDPPRPWLANKSPLLKNT